MSRQDGGPAQSGWTVVERRLRASGRPYRPEHVYNHQNTRVEKADQSAFFKKYMLDRLEQFT